MPEFKNKRKEGDIDSKSKLSDDGECCFKLMANFDLLNKCKSYYGKLVIQDGTRGKAGNCEINEFTDDLDLEDVPANQLPACILNAKTDHIITIRFCDFDSSAFKNNKGKIIKPDKCLPNEIKTTLASTTIKMETSSMSKGTKIPFPRTSADSNNIKTTTEAVNQMTSIAPENRTNTSISSTSGTTKASSSVGDENQSTTIKTSSKRPGNKTTSSASQSTTSGGDFQSQTRPTEVSIVAKSTTINSSTTIPIETSRDETTSEIKQTENGLQEGDQSTESPQDLTITIKETTTQFLPITEEISSSRPKNEAIEEIEVFRTNRGKNALKSEEQKDMVMAIIVAVLVIGVLFAVVAFIIFVAWKKKKIKAEMNKKGKKVEGSKKKPKNKSRRDKSEGSKQISKMTTETETAEATRTPSTYA